MGAELVTDTRSNQSAQLVQQSEGSVQTASQQLLMEGQLQFGVLAAPPAPSPERPATALARSKTVSENNNPVTEDASKPNGVVEGIKSTLYTIFAEDFVNAGKGVLAALQGGFIFQMKSTLAVGQVLIGDLQGARETFSEACKSLNEGINALVQNSISILFAAATIVTAVGTGGVATAGVLAIRAALKEGVKVAIKQLGKLIAEKIGYAAAKSLFENGLKEGLEQGAKLALKWGADKLGITTMKEVFKDGFKEGVLTMAQYASNRTGLTTARNIFNDGGIEGLKRIGQMLVEASRAQIVAATKFADKSHRGQMAQSIIQQTDELGKILGRSLENDLLALDKLKSREESMAKATQRVMNQRIHRVGNSQQDLVSILKSDIDTTVSEIHGATKVVSDEVAELVDDKVYKVLNLVHEGSFDKEFVERELRKLNFSDADIEDAKRIILNPDMRVGIRSKAYDKAIIERLTSSMQDEAERVVREQLASGKLGVVYKAKMHAYFDDLVKQGKLTDEQAKALKEVHDLQIDDMYITGVRDGIKRGIMRGFSRFRAQPDVYYTLPEVAAQRRKAKSEQRKIGDIIDSDSDVDYTKHQYHSSALEESSKNIPVSGRRHYMEAYFAERERLDSLQNGNRRGTKSKDEERKAA